MKRREITPEEDLESIRLYEELMMTADEKQKQKLRRRIEASQGVIEMKRAGTLRVYQRIPGKIGPKP